MDKFKTLSGEELVALGAKKVNCTLPELGLKDVVPNGSWLEQKQIQNSLEARRHIVEVERIEKRGTLSHAEWNEKLNLAEVSKQAGGHWQYVGHNVGRNLYLYPEEALLLMEINCLQLTHNGVTVSVQQAYSLLLKDNISLVQYKVYASLSRLGYKVLRHTYVKNETENIDSTIKTEHPSSNDNTYDVANIIEKQVENINTDQRIEEITPNAEDSDCEINKIYNSENADATMDSIKMKTVSDKLNLGDKNLDNKTDGNVLSEKDKIENIENGIHNSTVDHKENCTLKDVENVQMEPENVDDKVKVCSSVILCDDDNEEMNEVVEGTGEISNTGSAAIIQNKINMLSSRELRPRDPKVVHESFNENLPDLYQKHIVTVKAPEEQLIPRNVFLNNTAYVLNLENLKQKSVTPASSSSSQTYSTSDEANAQHIRRIRSGYSNESAHSSFTPQFFPNMRFPQQSHHYRFNYWNQFNYSWAYQRPYFPMPCRFQVFPRMQPMYRFFPGPSEFVNNENPTRRARKRKRNDPKKYHLESIKKLASKLKSLVASGNRQEGNIQALKRLIDTYNTRYQTRLDLTDQLDVVENEIILDTIDLDDDGQSSSKKKKNEDLNMYDENFEAVKQFAARIKELASKHFLSARHRRAFSNVIRTFNKSYNADIYVESNYEVIDRRHIVIPSSSDSECTIEETKPVEENTSKRRRSMKLRNPFYILKQLSEKHNSTVTSLDLNESSQSGNKKFEYSKHLKSVFSNGWLPSEDDFGRAEVSLKIQIKHLMDHSENFLYEFMRDQPVTFKNWLDAKIAYWQSAQKFEAQSQSENKVKLNSIINPEDCTDLRSVLKKLSVIKTSQDVQECSLGIHFDVYHRDVPNFKKSKKPKPHFRVICIDETSAFPTGKDFASLHSKYKDDIGIVFAIVGISSVSYLQMNPTDLPIYIPTTNLS